MCLCVSTSRYALQASICPLCSIFRFFAAFRIPFHVGNSYCEEGTYTFQKITYNSYPTSQRAVLPPESQFLFCPLCHKTMSWAVRICLANTGLISFTCVWNICVKCRLLGPFKVICNVSIRHPCHHICVTASEPPLHPITFSYTCET